MSTDNNDKIDVYITCVDSIVTVINNNITVAEFEIDYNIEGLTVILGSSIDINGNFMRYANCTIHEFYVKKI